MIKSFNSSSLYENRRPMCPINHMTLNHKNNIIEPMENICCTHEGNHYLLRNVISTHEDMQYRCEEIIHFPFSEIHSRGTEYPDWYWLCSSQVLMVAFTGTDNMSLSADMPHGHG